MIHFFGYFLVNFGKIRLLLILTSGHTGHKSLLLQLCHNHFRSLTRSKNNQNFNNWRQLLKTF